MKGVKQRKGESAGAASEPGSPSAPAHPIKTGPVGAGKRARDERGPSPLAGFKTTVVDDL